MDTQIRPRMEDERTRLRGASLLQEINESPLQILCRLVSGLMFIAFFGCCWKSVGFWSLTQPDPIPNKFRSYTAIVCFSFFMGSIYMLLKADEIEKEQRKKIQDPTVCVEPNLPPGFKSGTIYQDTSKAANETVWYVFNPNRIASVDEMLKVSAALSKIELKQIAFSSGYCQVVVENTGTIYDFESFPKVVETWPMMYELEKEGELLDYDFIPGHVQ